MHWFHCKRVFCLSKSTIFFWGTKKKQIAQNTFKKLIRKDKEVLCWCRKVSTFGVCSLSSYIKKVPVLNQHFVYLRMSWFDILWQNIFTISWWYSRCMFREFGNSNKVWSNVIVTLGVTAIEKNKVRASEHFWHSARKEQKDAELGKLASNSLTYLPTPRWV